MKIIYVDDEQAAVTINDIIKQVEKARLIVDAPEKAVKIQTMPNFDVFVDGSRLHFKSEKAKELLHIKR